MDSNDPLSELADIHVPQEPGLWPPAPGWWILGMVALGLIIWALLLANRRWQRRRRYHYALAELDRCLTAYHENDGSPGTDDAAREQAKLDTINEINAVLRRVALKHFPRSDVASLSGERWVEFLRNNGDASLLDGSQEQALARGRFARHCEARPEDLHATAQRWIRSLYLTETGTDKTHAENTTAADHA